MKYKLVMTLLTYGLISTILFSMTIVASLPNGPASLPKNIQLHTNTLLYQGWGFFSKNPRDPILNAYSLDTNEELSWPNNRVSNLFGIDRTGRMQGIELGTIIANIPQDKYITCENSSKNCLNDVEIFTVNNNNPNPSICGLWAIENVEPIPWSWGSYKDSVNMPSDVTKADIIC